MCQVISRGYEHASIILTTNSGIADWGPHLRGHHRRGRRLDRFLHHATVLSITGDSYRMRRNRDAIAALRPALAGPHTVGNPRDHTCGIPVILDTAESTDRGQTMIRPLSRVL